MSDLALSIYTPIAIMLVLGMPHGALDAHIVNSATRNKRQTIGLLFAYVLLALATVLFWWAFPTIAIAIFLALSTVHFGRSDLYTHQKTNAPSTIEANAGINPSAQDFVRFVTHGGIWTVLLPLIQWDLVEPIFSVLGCQTVIVKYALNCAALIWGLCLLVTLFAYRQTRVTKQPIILFAGVSVAILAPPLWALCLYFCFWHARRHTTWVLSTFPPRSVALRFMVVFSLIPLTGMLCWFLFIPTELNLEGLSLQLFFIGIFALTVPHMLLIDYYLGSKPTVHR
jgi:Brp/Blh family beta-carotene 15,15'-monooxygenase